MNIFNFMEIEDDFKVDTSKKRDLNFDKYRTEIILLIIGFFFVIISYKASIYDIKGLWFMRSGAILVLFAAIVEFRLNDKTLKSINRKNVGSHAFKTPINMNNSKEHNIIAFIAHIFIILGTLIWGYGDLI